MENWNVIQNRKRIKITKEYLTLLHKRGAIPKQVADKVCKKYGVCRKTIYNYLRKFRDIPLRAM